MKKQNHTIKKLNRAMPIDGSCQQKVNQLIDGLFAVAILVLLVHRHLCKGFVGTIWDKHRVVTKTFQAFLLNSNPSFADAFKQIFFLIQNKRNNRTELCLPIRLPFQINQ